MKVKVTIFHVSYVSYSPVLVTGWCCDGHTVNFGEPPLPCSPSSALLDDTCRTERESGEGHWRTGPQRLCQHKVQTNCHVPFYPVITASSETTAMCHVPTNQKCNCGDHDMCSWFCHCKRELMGVNGCVGTASTVGRALGMSSSPCISDCPPTLCM